MSENTKEVKQKRCNLISRFKQFCLKHRFNPNTVMVCGLVLIIVICVLVGGAFSIARVKTKTTALGLRDIGELATQVAYYTNVQSIESAREILGIAMPLTQSKYIFSYDGIIKAGLDFTSVNVKAN